jgi:hypothetical protein
MFFGDGGSGRGITMPGAEIPNDLVSWYCCHDLDTIGHELTHDVVQESAGLDLNDSLWAGTLNESISDCLGMMVKHWSNNLTVDESDWDISPGWWARTTLTANGWTKNYCRTFRKANPKDQEAELEPKHMGEWVETDDPHPNCGIPNHDFYLAALQFGGYAWKSVGRIWYEALVDPVFQKQENQDFHGFATLTCKQALKMFGSKAEAIIRRAWTKVGIFKVNDFAPHVRAFKGPSTRDQISRLGCSTAQYHPVVVISEDMLNAQLESYYNIEPKLRTMKVENPNLKTGIDAELAPPRIEIPANAEGLDRSKVIYHVRIKKGAVAYTSIPPHLFNPQVHKLKYEQIKDWDFAFQVNLGMYTISHM